MPDTDATQIRPPLVRAMGWVGLWLCAASWLPLLAIWVQFFNPRRPMRLPPVGSGLFWTMLGMDAFVASSMTLSLWQDSKKPKKRKSVSAPTAPKDRLKPWLAAIILPGFLVLRVLAANPGASVNWVGVGSGLLALGLLLFLMNGCTKLTQPPQAAEGAEKEAEKEAAAAPGPGWSPVAAPPPPAFGVRPPKNKCWAEVSAREAVYRRSTSARISAGVGGLFFASLAAGCLWFTLVGLGLVFASGMRGNPALTLMMGSGSLLFLSAFASIVMTTGPRELRVSPLDRTYTYRICSPVRWTVLTGWAGKSGKDELGVPWQVLEYRGSLNDIAGIRRLESIYKSNTSYTVFLCWHEPGRPAMRVGFSSDEDKARALQAQAAEDLGVPPLPDEADGD